MSRKRKEPVQKQETDSSTDSDDESTTKRLKSEVHVIRQAPEASQFPFFPPSRTEDPLRQAARSSSRLAASRTYIPEVQERMESLVSAERIALQDHFGTTDVYFQEELEDLMVRSEFAKVVSIYANPSTFVAGSVFDYVRGRHDERTDKKRKNARTDAQRANLTRVFLLNENAKVGTIMLLVHSDLYDAWLYYCKKFDQDPELEPANCEPQAALWLQSLSDKTYKDLGHMKSIKDVNERAFVRHSMARVKTPTTGGLRVAAGIPVELSRNPTKAEQESGITERLTPNLNAPRIYNTADRSTSTDTGDLIFFSSKAAKMAQAALVANGVAIIGFTDVVIPEPSAADGHIVIGDPVRFHVEPQVSVTVTQDQRTVQVGEETYEVLDEIVDKGESQEEDMEVEAIMATPSTSREPQRRLESRSGSVTPPTCAPSTLLRSRSSQRREARLKAEEETGGVVPKKLKKNQYRVLGATPEDDTLDLALHPEDFFSDVESLGSHHKALTRNERELVMGRFKKPRFTSDGCILAVEGARYWVGQRRDPDCPKPFCTIAANNLRQTDFEKTWKEELTTISLIAAKNQTPRNGPRKFDVKSLPRLIHYTRGVEQNNTLFQQLLERANFMRESSDFAFVMIKVILPSMAKREQLMHLPNWRDSFFAIAVTTFNLKTVVVHVNWNSEKVLGARFPPEIRAIFKNPSIAKIGNDMHSILRRLSSLKDEALVMRSFVDASNLALMAFPQYEVGHRYLDIKTHPGFVATQVAFPTIYVPRESVTDAQINDPTCIMYGDWEYDQPFKNWTQPMNGLVIWEAAVIGELLRQMAIKCAELEHMGPGADILRIIHCLLAQCLNCPNMVLAGTKSDDKIRPYGTWFTHDGFEENGERLSHRVWPLFLTETPAWLTCEELHEGLCHLLQQRRWQRSTDIIPADNRKKLVQLYQMPLPEIDRKACMLKFAGRGIMFPHACLNCNSEDHRTENCDVDPTTLHCEYNVCLMDGHVTAVCPSLHARCDLCSQLGHFRRHHQHFPLIVMIEEFFAMAPQGRVTSRLSDANLVAQFHVDPVDERGFILYKAANTEELQLIRASSGEPHH